MSSAVTIPVLLSFLMSVADKTRIGVDMPRILALQVLSAPAI